MWFCRASSVLSGWRHDARGSGSGWSCRAVRVADGDRASLAPEAQVSSDEIPKDHAEELGDCFAAHARGLFGYACALTRGDRALADDLVQSAFVAAARQWPTMRCLRDAQRLRWLQTTVSNLAISSFRRNGSLGDHLPRLEAMSRPPPPDTPAEAVAGIALERCWQAIQALPPQQHAVAVMRWLFALTSTEIAARLDIADGTVAAHMSAVRGKLKAALGPYDPFSSEDGPSS
jgi:RNA polymerase sigma-70 factor (ECF subfamily)